MGRLVHGFGVALAVGQVNVLDISLAVESVAQTVEMQETTGGTNHLHGSVFEFARNYFDGKRIPEFQRNDFGAALGGPLRKDSSFSSPTMRAIVRISASPSSRLCRMQPHAQRLLPACSRC